MNCDEIVSGLILEFRRGTLIMVVLAQLNKPMYGYSLIKELEKRFPGRIILKNDSNYLQGVPDLSILYGSRWATLECKRSQKAIHQPNQEYYVDRMDHMSFSRFICPENREEILDELQSAFGT